MKLNQRILPPVIKLSSDKVILEGKGDSKGLENILDANPSTLWSSSKDGLPTVISMDLGTKFSLQGSKIVWGKDSDWYTYSLEVSRMV